MGGLISKNTLRVRLAALERARGEPSALVGQNGLIA